MEFAGVGVGQRVDAEAVAQHGLDLVVHLGQVEPEELLGPEALGNLLAGRRATRAVRGEDRVHGLSLPQRVGPDGDASVGAIDAYQGVPEAPSVGHVLCRRDPDDLPS